MFNSKILLIRSVYEEDDHQYCHVITKRKRSIACSHISNQEAWFHFDEETDNRKLVRFVVN